MRESLDERQFVFPASISISSNEESTKGEPLTTKTEAGITIDFRDRRPQKASLFICLSVVPGLNVSHESRVIPLKHSSPSTLKGMKTRSRGGSKGVRLTKRRAEKDVLRMGGGIDVIETENTS
jgi:hypothetical protein